MKIQARKLSAIPVSDKPLSQGAQIHWMTPEFFKQRFGFEYDEKIECEDSRLDFSNFQESIEGRLSSSQLKAQLEVIIQHPHQDLVLCLINEDVGFGLFAMNDIPKDTVLCFYSGTMVSGNKSSRSDHAMGIYGVDIAVSTQHHRGISSFFQHLPGVPPVPNKDMLMQILRMTGQSVSESALMIDEELYSIEFLDNKTRSSLATANIRREYVLHQGIPVICLVTNRTIKAQEQLGLKYAQFLWSRGIVPELFDQSGARIPSTRYRRTFAALDFDGFSYTGDLKPLVEQLKQKSLWITFKDDANIERRLEANTMVRALKKVHAITADIDQQSISMGAGSSLFCPAMDVIVQKLVRKYKLLDETQASFEKGLRNAAANNFIEDVKAFLTIVLNIDAMDDNVDSRRTALIHAARKGYWECYQLLIERGANPDIEDASGKTAQQYLEKTRFEIK